MSQNVSPGPTTNVVVQPAPTNGLGIAGFIISLLGFLSCGLLSPIGFLLSLVGLTKQPRGFAIAGAIIGAIGTLGLFLFGFAMIAALLGLSSAARQIQQEVQKELEQERMQQEFERQKAEMEAEFQRQAAQGDDRQSNDTDTSDQDSSSKERGGGANSSSDGSSRELVPEPDGMSWQARPPALRSGQGAAASVVSLAC
ncbi:MAG TPA: hypothetical protein ENJ50_08425, partial [Planctomycetaceae bacterium]|nr:hypothetical protein [Planctomycetaceae bacterium]